MAQNISNVRSINDAPKRGRQTKAAKEAEKAALEAKRLREDEARGLKNPTVDDDFDEETRTAPGFGHNEPDAPIFLRHFQIIGRQQEKIEAAKLVLKTEKGIMKDLRKVAQSEGIVMREFDMVREAVNTERVDLVARDQRWRYYCGFLGLDLTVQTELELHAKEGDAVLDAKRWWKRGDLDGRLGRIREVPLGCPPEHIQDWLKGHDNGQEVLMRGLPLTREGFGDQDPPKTPVAASEDKGKILVLHEGHFVAGTGLEDANTSTLLPEHLEAVERATYVSAVFGPAKRLIKEPGYLDDGSENTEVTEPEIVVLDASDLA